MAQSRVDADFSEVRLKVANLSRRYPICGTVSKSINCMNALMKNESFNVAQASISKKTNLYKFLKNERNEPIHDMLYDINNYFKSLISFMAGREKKRTVNVSGKKSSTTQFESTEDPVNNKLACEICGKLFSSPRTLKEHSKCHLENEDERKPHKCPRCPRRFAQIGHRQQHELTHLTKEDPGYKKYQCELCNQSFCRPEALRVHGQIHMDQSMRKAYECDVCEYRCHYVSSLNKHKKTHLADDDPNKMKFACNVCGRRFINMTSLTRHTKAFGDRCNKERPFECDLCPHKATRKEHLENHKSWVHGIHKFKSRKVRTLKCDHCGGGFVEKRYLNKHMRNQHGVNIPKIIKEQPYMCDICEKLYAHKRNVWDHKRKFHPNASNKLSDIVKREAREIQCNNKEQEVWPSEEEIEDDDKEEQGTERETSEEESEDDRPGPSRNY